MTLADRWQQRQFKRFRKRITNYADSQQWSRALLEVIDAAQWAQDRVHNPDLWMDLIIDATSLLPHLDDPAEYRAFLDHFAIPFFGDQIVDPRWLDALAELVDHTPPASMIALGLWLADALPDAPLGPYIAAHFQERLPRTDDARDIPATADHFQQALERARRRPLPRWIPHLSLRLGAFLITSGHDRRRGRQLLTSLDWSTLAPQDQLWMAVALACCPHWTDRLRAMDILLDIHRARRAARPGYGDLRDNQIHHAASSIFKLASLDLPDAEAHRIDELIDQLFVADEHRRWRHFLDARQTLNRQSSLAFTDLGSSLDTLRPLADDPAWTPLFQRLELLHAGWHHRYPGDDALPLRQRRSRRFPIADATSRLLAQLQGTQSPSPSALEQLCDALGDLDPAGDGAAARPVALLFTRLLDVAPDLDDHALFHLRRIAERYARVAPSPSFGWWALAAHLFAGDFPRLARPIADRARTDRDSASPDKCRAFVIQSMLQLAITQRDTQTCRLWIPLATDQHHGRSPS